LIKIYQNQRFKIKVNRRNGWKEKQIKEIYSRLKVIKSPPSARNTFRRHNSKTKATTPLA
ncbi:MAG: hypothetical protein V1783_11420, partial [Bacteroidota bacterium]